MYAVTQENTCSKLQYVYNEMIHKLQEQDFVDTKTFVEFINKMTNITKETDELPNTVRIHIRNVSNKLIDHISDILNDSLQDDTESVKEHLSYYYILDADCNIHTVNLENNISRDITQWDMSGLKRTPPKQDTPIRTPPFKETDTIEIPAKITIKNQRFSKLMERLRKKPPQITIKNQLFSKLMDRLRKTPDKHKRSKVVVFKQTIDQWDDMPGLKRAPPKQDTPIKTPPFKEMDTIDIPAKITIKNQRFSKIMDRLRKKPPQITIKNQRFSKLMGRLRKTPDKHKRSEVVVFKQTIDQLDEVPGLKRSTPKQDTPIRTPPFKEMDTIEIPPQITIKNQRFSKLMGRLRKTPDKHKRTKKNKDRLNDKPRLKWFTPNQDSPSRLKMDDITELEWATPNQDSPSRLKKMEMDDMTGLEWATPNQDSPIQSPMFTQTIDQWNDMRGLKRTPPKQDTPIRTLPFKEMEVINLSPEYKLQNASNIPLKLQINPNNTYINENTTLPPKNVNTPDKSGDDDNDDSPFRLYNKTTTTKNKIRHVPDKSGDDDIDDSPFRLYNKTTTTKNNIRHVPNIPMDYNPPMGYNQPEPTDNIAHPRKNSTDQKKPTQQPNPIESKENTGPCMSGCTGLNEPECNQKEHCIYINGNKRKYCRISHKYKMNPPKCNITRRI